MTDATTRELIQWTTYDCSFGTTRSYCVRIFGSDTRHRYQIKNLGGVVCEGGSKKGHDACKALAQKAIDDLTGFNR